MKLHPQRHAEAVADELRGRIMDGELPEGSELPSQDRLSEQLGVPRPVLREALLTLEVEGLLTVRRGNKGGAIVHLPSPLSAAYGLGLVFEARHVRVSQLRAGVHLIEPLCARLCAERPDRDTTVVPTLRRLHAEAIDRLHTLDGFVDATHRFHRALTTSCGNEIVAVVAAALDEVYTRAREPLPSSTTFPDLDYRRRAVRAHAELIDFIAAGDGPQAAAVAERHFDPSEFTVKANVWDRPVGTSGFRRR